MKLKFDYLTKCLLLLLVVMGMSSLAMAQRSIKGVVTDAENGDPLIGANILVVGTSVGTITDVDGSYALQVPAGATELEVTYTGYGAQRVGITGDVVNITLAAGALLDEIVVVGYSSVKKSDLTGSVVAVGEKDFNRGVITSPEQLIQGRAAGVQIINNNGQPGGSTTVRIRGNSSVRAGNEPLYVVDGVQLTGQSAKPGGSAGVEGSTPSSNPLNYLNSTDIESIQVLKDASATAIYGARGANGVIIITTKKGKAGAPSIEFGTSLGSSNKLNQYEVLTADEYRDALSEYGLTAGDYGDDVNAMDEITRTGLTTNNTISVSGGNADGTYRMALGYLNSEGIMKESGMRRISANLSGSYKFLESKRLGLDINVIASQVRETGAPITNNAGFRGSLIGNALQWNPTHAMYNTDGSPVIIPAFGNFTNPVALLEAYDDRSNVVNMIGSFTPSYKLTDNLTYKMQYSVNHGVGDRRSYMASWINIQDVEGRGVATYEEAKLTNQILTHTLNLNQDVTDGLNLNAVAGYEYQKLQRRGLGMSARDFIVQDFDYTNIFQNSKTDSRNVYGFADPDAEIQSYFLQTLWNLNDKYLLTATFRADGSSKFGKNNKYAYFPAVAFAWNLHNEGFLEGNDLFSQLKLRLSYGKTGNSEFPAGAAQERYTLEQQSTRLTNVANPDLKWETTTTFGAGIDFGLMEGRVNGTIEYFNKNGEDLLFQFTTIQPAPAGFYWINLPGNVINKGLEASVDFIAVDNEKLTWDIGLNASFLSNVIEDYNGPNLEYGEVFGQGSSGAVSQRLASGQPLNAFYLRQFTGINESGQSEYVGGTAETLAYVGDPNPDMLLGFNTNITAGKLSFSMNFAGAMGHQIYNNTKMSVTPIGNLGSRNIDKTLLEGDVKEATSNAIKASSRYLEDGDYLKLQNATLGYNLGNLGNVVKNARIYLTGQNLLVFTGYKGFDPEVNTVNFLNGLPSMGIDYIPYPSARTFIFGVNFSF